MLFSLGNIVGTDLLDYNKVAIYNFVVRACDEGIPMRCNDTSVSIRITETTTNFFDVTTFSTSVLDTSAPEMPDQATTHAQTAQATTDARATTDAQSAVCGLSLMQPVIILALALALV